MIVIAHEGGGGKGAFGAGALEVIEEAGIKIGGWEGVSVGALNGAGWSVGGAALLRRVWFGIAERDVFIRKNAAGMAWRVLVQGRRSVYDFAPLGRTIRKHLGPGPYPGVRVGTVDTRRRPWRFQMEPADADSVLASASMPIVAEPVNGRLDGGIAHAMPIKAALERGADRIICILCTPREVREQEPDEPGNAWEVGTGSLELALHTATVSDIDGAFQRNERIRLAQKCGEPVPTAADGRPYRYANITVIEPPEPLGGTLDFSQTSIRRRYELGRRAARDQLGTREAA
jgi:predicted acylesterase/phospholipase RssA